MDASREVAEIERLLRAKAAALPAQDRAFFEAFIGDDFVYVNTGGKRLAKAEYIAAWCDAPDIRFREQDLSDLSIRVAGDTAVAVARMEDHILAKGVAHVFKVDTLCVLQRRAGAWRWIAGQTMGAKG